MPFVFPSTRFEREHIQTFHKSSYAAVDTAQALKGSMKGLNVLVTGAGRGIGEGIALAFAEAGAATVILTSRSMDQLEAVATKVERFGTRAIPVEVNVTSEASVAALFKHLDDQGIVVDVACLNAGFFHHRVLMHEMDPAEWRSTWDVHVHGVYHPSRELLIRHMKTRATGRELFIIVTTSVAAFYGGGTGSGYSPSKSAQQRIVESLNAEYAEHGVRAFGVHPCNAATEMVAGKVSQEFADESLDEDPLLPGQFFVWLVATKEAQKLQGRYTNATWDVDELLAAIRGGKLDDPECLMLRPV